MIKNEKLFNRHALNLRFCIIHLQGAAEISNLICQLYPLFTENSILGPSRLAICSFAYNHPISDATNKNLQIIVRSVMGCFNIIDVECQQSITIFLFIWVIDSSILSPNKLLVNSVKPHADAIIWLCFRAINSLAVSTATAASRQ